MWEAGLASHGGFAVRSGPHSGHEGPGKGSSRWRHQGCDLGVRRTGLVSRQEDWSEGWCQAAWVRQ